MIWLSGRCVIFFTLTFVLTVVARAQITAGGAGYSTRRLAMPSQGNPGFSLVDPKHSGIVFSNLISVSRYTTNQMLLNGAGVAAGDVDGDGRCDLYFCGADNPNVLYRNLGNWQFEDITARAGVACADMSSSGAAFADIDGDGDLDLIVNSWRGGTRVLINDGQGNFTELRPEARLNLNRNGTSLALADVDGDGDLDLYVANNRSVTIRDEPEATFTVENVGGKLIVKALNGMPAAGSDLEGRFTFDVGGKISEHGEVDALYVNDGQGNFTPFSFLGGNFLDERGRPLTSPPHDWGLAVMFRDMNGDLAPDIYVCNDFSSPDRIWLNDGKGKFRAAPGLTMRRTSVFSMGVDFADINRDGLDDFFVADMLSRDPVKRQLQVGDLSPSILPIGQVANRPQYSRNTLFLNRGDGTYAEIASFSGVEASEWSWTPLFLDVDLDGFEDLLITTGHHLETTHIDVINEAEVVKARRKMSKMEILNLRHMFPRHPLPKVAFRNLGNLKFEDAGHAWGFDHVGVAHGMAVADLDNDGDLDVVVNHLDGVAGIFRNEGNAPRIAVRLKGLPPNTRGIGAKIHVRHGATPIQSQEVICGGRYLSSDDSMRVFAAGSETNRMTLEVVWRSGRRSVVHDAVPNHLYIVEESGAESFEEKKIEIKPVFEDISASLKHLHTDTLFDDFQAQSLLFRKFSQLGPGVAWNDIDGDGWDDLVIASGKGGSPGVFRNDRKGGFTRLADPPLDRKVGRDQTTVLGLGATLLVGSANYEDGSKKGGSINLYDLERGISGDSVLGPVSSAGPLALADVDGDGRLDMFVGGRITAGRYPEPATSILLRNEAGKFVPLQQFEKFGLVSGAVFGDIDDDGVPELILACEWGPIRVLRREQGMYREVTEKSGLANYKGWWNGVALGDLDGDGRLDIIASNWGLNSSYRASPQIPLRCHYGNLDSDGRFNFVETQFDPVHGKELPLANFKFFRAAMPLASEKYATFEAFARSSIQEILGPSLQTNAVLEVNTLASAVFFNRGEKFEMRELPAEAQFAPAFGVCVGDMDGDGMEDLFLSQNFFAVHPETARCDAGLGLWLKGDGRGGFTALSGQQSGVKVYGEQRGCALSDFDQDGRIDLAVTQNGTATRLFRNKTARPGLRVRLQGDQNNATAVGATLRLEFDGWLGPRRLIAAGSGYWSQNGMVQVLGTPEPPRKIHVRWPGGRETVSEIPLNAKEVVVKMSGAIEKTQ